MKHRHKALRLMETSSHSHQFKTSLLSLREKSNTHVLFSLAVSGWSPVESSERRFSGSITLWSDSAELWVWGLLTPKLDNGILVPVFPCR